MGLFNTIREMFKPLPFNPIMQPEDLVCTHEGSSSCAVPDSAMRHYAGVYVPPRVKDSRYDVMSFDQGGETVWPK